MTAPVLSAAGWKAILEWLPDLIEDEEFKKRVQVALGAEDDGQLVALVDLDGLSREVVAWVQDSPHAQFKVGKAPVKLVVLFRATGHKARPYSLELLESYSQSSAHRQASDYLDFCFSRGLLHDSDISAGQCDEGVHKLVQSLPPVRMVQIQAMWSNHGRVKKKAAQADASRAVSKPDQRGAASEQGEVSAGGAVAATKELEESRPLVSTVYLRPKHKGLGGSFIDEILNKLNVGSLVDIVDGAYKVKTSAENLQRLKDAVANVAEVEELSEAKAVQARTFAQQRALEERVAREEELPPRDMLLGMQLVSAKSENPLLQAMGQSLLRANARREALIERGEDIRTTKKQRRADASAEVKDEEDDVMAPPV